MKGDAFVSVDLDVKELEKCIRRNKKEKSIKPFSSTSFEKKLALFFSSGGLPVLQQAGQVGALLEKRKKKKKTFISFGRETT